MIQLQIQLCVRHNDAQNTTLTEQAPAFLENPERHWQTKMLQAMFGKDAFHRRRPERNAVPDIPAHVHAWMPEVINIDELLMNVLPASNIEIAQISNVIF